ncbi:MAG TPA: threonine/serine dehydratase [Thermoanaerobaculia bacterium]|jgi:threonine dehydratase|nr:threonine/serine dehydratase [Thermoanaerobaculia bacterium]
MTSGKWPIEFRHVLEARRRIRPYIPPTPLRRYAALDEALGDGVRVWVKHENHNPTNSFKARNAMSVLTALPDAVRKRGILGASRGNWGQGLAWAGSLLGAPVVVCVPVGNNPEKNEAMRGFGADLVEEGRDYDESVQVALRILRERGLTMVHATNEPLVVAGAATLTLEVLDERPEIEAIVVAVGGGSQAVGAMTVARAIAPAVKVYGVQAERASAIHDSWHAGRVVVRDSADTFADGLATRQPYDGTFPALQQGLSGFVTVSEAVIAEAVRLLLSTTHNLAEGAGAAGVAGVRRLAGELAGRDVAVILSGGNMDAATLRRVMTREL